MSESAYNSPLFTRRLTESCCSSPARSIGQQTPEVLTDSDGDCDAALLTETPGVPDQTVIAGWLKFRDNKKVSRFSPEEEYRFLTLILYFYPRKSTKLELLKSFLRRFYSEEVGVVHSGSLSCFLRFQCLYSTTVSNCFSVSLSYNY